MSAVDRLAALQRFAELAIASGDAELAQIGASFAKWLQGGQGAIEEALGIPDLALVRTAACLEARDHAVRELAQRFGFRAAEIASLMLEYECSTWPSDASLASCPARLLGTPQEFCWRALRARPHVPSPKWIRDILKHGSQKTCEFRSRSRNVTPERNPS